MKKNNCDWCNKSFYTEKIADDYAIEFAEWVCNNLYDFPKTEQKYILEIFKKEKGY